MLFIYLSEFEYDNVILNSLRILMTCSVSQCLSLVHIVDHLNWK